MMGATKTQASRERFRSLVDALVENGQLALAPGATTPQLTAAFETDSSDTSLLDDATALMDWLVNRPEVDELFTTDTDFVQALVRSHPAAPKLHDTERPAFAGMVTRAYDLLASLRDKAGAGRRFAVIELASPSLYARSAATLEALDDDDPTDVGFADLDPLNLGESGPSALDPSEYEMIRALGVALGQPVNGVPICTSLADAGLSLTLVCNESAPIVLDLSVALDAKKVARALGCGSP